MMKLQLTQVIAEIWFVFGMIALCLYFCGCGAEFLHTGFGVDGCEPQDFQCQGTELQICNADKNWEPITDCTNFEPGDWACCNSECQKVEECR
jgi:hypothetical protein